MARQKNIKFQMKQELQKMEAYGRSKHADQLKTKEERSTLKANGVPFEQYRNIDYTVMRRIIVPTYGNFTAD